MGDIASRLADLVFVTSDNSRSEKPENIMQEILGGILAVDRPKVTLEADRARAIGAAIRAAVVGDVVIIAGKGHEKYQIFSDRTVPFDDVDVARGVLNSL
jgi:UDP-N-acetylmuramoyl-L-alanyl-D-glutamate--2,6-diaminopimelate ligase